MRKLIALAIFLIPSVVFGQAMSVRNDEAGTTGYVVGNGNHQNSAISVDSNGRVFVTLVAGVAGTNNAIKNEDLAHVSGDAAIAALGLRNDAIAVTTGTDLDYQLPSLNNRGVAYTALIDGTTTAWKAEDQVSADAAAVFTASFVREDALTQNTNASGDYTWGKTDAMGRLITTGAPAGETFQSCGTATAVTSDVAIKAAVASNRMYTTGITCKNTSTTVGPTLDFKDGATIIAVGGVTATSATGTLQGSVSYTFPTPLRGTSNTALNFATNTATTSVTCCAVGYVSVN